MKGVMLAVILLAPAAAGAGVVEMQESITRGRVIVEGLDEKGEVLRNGLGFVWDDATVVCAYDSVRGASSIRVMMEGWASRMNHLLFFDESYDLAVLRSEEEVPQALELGSSSTLAAGDGVFYFSRQKASFLLQPAIVRNWVDSGKGYEICRLQSLASPEERSIDEPSPVFSVTGKVVGWLMKNTSAIPLEAIGRLIEQKMATVTLPEAGARSTYWKLRNVVPVADQEGTLKFSETKDVSGPKQYPFQLEIPRHWQVSTSWDSGRYLLRASDAVFGICMELRALPQDSEDLLTAAEQSETLLFPGMPRQAFEPYSADHFTGFRARYDNDKTMISAFYAMALRKLYILSVSCPLEDSGEIEPLVEQILSSFRIQ